MPLYEYYCADCRTKFEAIRPMNKADASIQCKNCESTRTSRALSLFAAHIKTTGETSTPAAGTGFGGGCCGGTCGCSLH